jgi:hypothetical protein
MSVVRFTTLLTGLPRSGTTLVCALLNECSDTVALAEPIRFPHGDRQQAVRDIDQFITSAREQAINANVALTRHIGGKVPDNWANVTSSSELRGSNAERGLISLNKPLSPAFNLIVKEPAGFTALSDLLSPRYPLVAMVRHPLAVLAAWQTVDMPVQRGRMPTAERLSPGLGSLLDSQSDRLSRQVALIGWLLEIYRAFPAEHILRYEDFVMDPGRWLSRFTPHEYKADRRLVVADPAVRYPGVALAPLARELIRICPIAEAFYPDFEESLARVI